MAELMRIVVVAASAFAGLVLPACAGGDDYDPASDTEGKGPVYFGFVRDHRGSSVADAQVTLRPKSGEPVVLKANALGIYRTHISSEVRPDEVELKCDKPGYRQVRVVRRNPPGSKDMLIETSCTMQRL